MQIFIKAALSLVIIFVATGIAKRFPSAAGLIGVMPLTGALVLVWIYLENKGDQRIMEDYTRGALWGILPIILFYGAPGGTLARVRWAIWPATRSMRISMSFNLVRRPLSTATDPLTTMDGLSMLQRRSAKAAQILSRGNSPPEGTRLR